MIGLTQQEKVEFERIKDEMWNYGYETAKEEFGWHPANEPPPLNECGISDAMICIVKNYAVCRSRYYKDSGWDYNVKWWCYPPKEK